MKLLLPTAGYLWPAAAAVGMLLGMLLGTTGCSSPAPTDSRASFQSPGAAGQDSTGVWNLAATDYGSPASPYTLVLLHGWSENRLFWGPLVEALGRGDGVHTDHAFRIIAPDLPGHGGSPDWASGGTPRDLAPIIARWLEAQETGPTILAGHGYGSTLALETAAVLSGKADPVGVICLHGLYDPTQPFAPEGMDSVIEALDEDLQTVMQSVAKSFIPAPDQAEVREWVGEQMASARSTQAVAYLRGLKGFDLRPTLRRLPLPVRAINGTFRTTNLTGVRSLIPNFDLQVLPDLQGSGFAPMLQAPEATSDAVRLAIAQILAGDLPDNILPSDR